MKKIILEEFIQKVWNEGNIDIIPHYIAEEYTVLHDPGDPWDGMVLDLAAFQARVSSSREPVPDQFFDIQHSFENDDSVCITWLWRGTHRGDISGFQPSGKTLRMSGSTVYFFRDEKITGHWQVVDRLGIFQQLQGNKS